MNKADEQRDRFRLSLHNRPPPSPTPPAPADPAPEVPRARPIRSTVDLPPDLHRQFQMWATERGAKMTQVYLSLVRRLLDDPALAAQIEADLRERDWSVPHEGMTS